MRADAGVRTLARRPFSQDRFFLKETVQWHVYR
jgi:hypothetical protein